MTAQDAAPVPLTLLTGFLGAGKTTLLNRLLREPALGRAAVVMNEFGAVGVDHLLVEGVGSDRLTLATGCICCAARGDLVTALEDLLGRRAAGLVAFDALMVETTGLADPRPVARALAAAPALRGHCRLGAVLAVVDARDGAAALDRHDEAARQAAMADVLAISKTDLPGAEPEALAARLALLNPLARVVDAADAGAVLAALDCARASVAATPVAAAGHGHRPHASLGAAVLRAGTVDEARFQLFVTLLLRRHGAGLLRLKGFVATRDDPSRPHLVQGVGATLSPALRLDRWPDGDRGTRLVAIAEGGETAAIAALWDDVFGPPALDRPDAAALAEVAGDSPGLF